jgi:hypothetical protein
MKNLLDSLDHAYVAKHHILVNVAAYHYVAQVPYTHKFKVSCGGWLKTGWVHKTETRYRDELRFDTDRYNRDVARADQNISYLYSQINQTIYNAQTQFENIKSAEKLTETEISSLQTKLQIFDKKYSIMRAKHEDSIRSLQNLSSQIQLVKQKIKNDEIILNQKEEELSLAEEKLTEAQVKFKSQVESISDKQRSYVFAENFGISGKEFVLKILQDVGFDAGLLGFYAINKNNKDLIKVALHNKADFGSYHYDTKSLIQHLVKSGNQELIDFVLSLDGQDFGTSLLTAIDQNDIETLKVVLSHNPYLSSSLHDNGYSLLHVAISMHKAEVVKALLALDVTLVDIKTTDLDSPFAIAIRQNNHDITTLLLPHINLNHEIQNLIDRGNTELLQVLKTMNVGLTEQEMLGIEQVLAGEDINPWQNQDLDLLIGQIEDFDIQI